MRQYSAFTLLELMITLAIVAVLATIAYPSYSAHLRHTYRQEAGLALMSLASAMETYYSINSTYRDATLAKLNTAQEVANQHYQLNIESTNDQSYNVAAIPQKDQLNDECGTLSTNELGDRLAKGSINAECWL